MAPKYQVFISSTYEDLADEREQVIKAVLEMGHIPVGMEMFSAADEQQWQIIASHIDESDYYVVLVAHRYGSKTDGVSYTRKEYEYAISRKVPVLGFIIDPKAKWPADRVDTGDVDKTRLDAFKSRIREKPVGLWTSTEDLHSKCSIALMKAFTTSPRDGWVRASSAVGPAVAAELSRLSSENADLRSQLGVQEREAKSSRVREFLTLDAILTMNLRKLSYRYVGGEGWEEPIDVALSEIFEELSPMLLVESSLKEAARYLAMILNDDEDRSPDIVAMNEVENVLSDLLSLDLVEPSGRKHSVNDDNAYWCLTDLGKDMLRWLRRQKLEQGTVEESESARGTVPAARKGATRKKAK